MPFGGMDGNFEEGQDSRCEGVASAVQDMSCWWWKGKGKGKGKKGKHCGKHFKGHAGHGKFENESKVDEEHADVEPGTEQTHIAGVSIEVRTESGKFG